jgi:hypothetical protein
MKEKVRFLGLDVHAETIAVAIAEPDGEVRSRGTIADSIANSNPLRSDMIGILPRRDYPIFSGGPTRDFCSLPLSDHSGPRTFWHVRTSTRGRHSPL